MMTHAGLSDSWKKHALGTINKVLREPLALKVVNVVGGGDQDWALVELEANAVCKNGMARIVCRLHSHLS